MNKMRKGAGSLFALAIGLILLSGSVHGSGLLDLDFVYLRTVHQLEPYDAPILHLSPKERSHLHDLINDARSLDELYARDQNVKDALALFLSHQDWEKANPGKLWDALDSKYPQ